MILPGSYLVSVVLLIVCTVCWTLWANLFKAAGKWRFELFCYDFAFGVLIAGVAIAFTFGSLGWDGFSMMDDLRIAGKRQDLYALLAGGLFNAGNILLLGAAALSGLSVAFPVGMGVAAIITGVWNFLANPPANPTLFALGWVVILAGALFAATGYRTYRMSRLLEQIREGKTKSTKKTTSFKAVIAAAIAGLLIGCFAPLLDLARAGENGLGPYSAGFLTAIAVFGTTFLWNLLLMIVPLHGPGIEVGDYLRGRMAQHLMGLAAGALWMGGALAALVAARGDEAVRAGAALTVALEHASVPLVALCGLVFWKEFAKSQSPARLWLTLAVSALIAGIGTWAFASAHGAQ